jgi:hypothetical protein
MTQYDNTNRGSLFKNDRKTADTHADYTGSINVNGQEFWLNAWLKESKSGGKFFSLSVRPKEARTAASEDRSATHVASDDAIPF